jgi:hypothetical protein
MITLGCCASFVQVSERKPMSYIPSETNANSAARGAPDGAGRNPRIAATPGGIVKHNNRIERRLLRLNNLICGEGSRADITSEKYKGSFHQVFLCRNMGFGATTRKS